MGVAVNVLLCILPDREGEKCPSCPASRSSPLMCWRCLMLVGSWSVPSELDQSQVGCPLAQTHLGLLALVGYSNPPKNPILSWLGWPTHQDHGSVPSKLSGQCHWLLFLISPRTTRVTRPPATGSRTDRVNSEPLPLPQLPKVQFYSAGTGPNMDRALWFQVSPWPSAMVASCAPSHNIPQTHTNHCPFLPQTIHFSLKDVGKSWCRNSGSLQWGESDPRRGHLSLLVF